MNVSIRPAGQAEFGTRCEIKNMNSMKFARGGGAVRSGAADERARTGPNESSSKPANITPKMVRRPRYGDKEEAHDYRYFPDPDLPPVVLDRYVFKFRSRRNHYPSPGKPTDAFKPNLSCPAADANLLSEDRTDYEAFLRYAAESPDVPALAKIWINRLAPWAAQKGISTAELPLSPVQLAAFQELILAGDVAAAAATGKLLPNLLATPGNPYNRAEELGLVQNSDGDFLSDLVTQVITDNPDKAAAYRNGKRGLIGFFMGEVMKRSGGSAEPKETKALLADALA